MAQRASFQPFLPPLLSVAVVAIGVLGYLLYAKHTEYDALSRAHDASVATTTAYINALEATLADTQLRLGEATTTNEELAENLEREQHKNEEFAEQIGDISKTVGVLEKLSKTDEELLQKYSKVYFLNEHYIPSDLDEIDATWKYTETKPNQFHGKAMSFLEDMLEAAKEDGINLWVVSAYRSFAQQSVLKGQYSVTYGSGANAFSADQGFSEHQLGTTLDLTTDGLGGGLTGFGNTPAYQWLIKNAHKYGFTLSYPEGNAYYVYEPWHWRFVGEDLAEDLHDAGAHFYDWDQRKIDEYLVSIFD